MYRLIVALICATTMFAGPPAMGREKKRSLKELANLDEQAFQAAGKKKFEAAARIWLDIFPEMGSGEQQKIRANLALAFRKLNRLPEAWHFLTRYLKNADTEDRKAGKTLQKVEDKLKETHVKMALACEPEGAILELGGAAHKLLPSHTCPLTWWFKPGKHTIKVSAAGHESRNVELNVLKRGGQAGHTVRLKKKADEIGTLVVQGDKRGYQVFLNGSLEGLVPFNRKLKVGDYDLMVGKPGKLPWKTKITIEAGKTHTEKPLIAQKEVAVVKPVDGTDKTDGKEPGKEPTGTIVKPAEVAEKTDILPWALIGAGGALAITGGVLNYLAVQDALDLDNKYTKPLKEYQQTAEYKSLGYEAALFKHAEYHDPWQNGMDTEVMPKQISAYVLYGLGAAAATTGLVLFFRGSGDGDSARADVKLFPMPLPAGAGMSIQFNY